MSIGGSTTHPYEISHGLKLGCVLARLKASTTTREFCIRELLYVDDAAIVAHTLEDTREI